MRRTGFIKILRMSGLHISFFFFKVNGLKLFFHGLVFFLFVRGMLGVQAALVARLFGLGVLGEGGGWGGRFFIFFFDQFIRFVFLGVLGMQEVFPVKIAVFFLSIGLFLVFLFVRLMVDHG